MTTSAESRSGAENMTHPRLSLGTAAARNLATTTKTVPQMQGITSRWLLRLLPWVEVSSGTYRVNRRLTHTLGDGRVEFVAAGAEVRVIPVELRELPLLRGFEDTEVLVALADRFRQRELAPGEVLVAAGEPADEVVLIAHGKIEKLGVGEYDEPTVLGSLADGDYLGDRELAATDAGTWRFTARAVTSATVLTLAREEFLALQARAEGLRSHVEAYRNAPTPPRNQHGEADIAIASGHVGEPSLDGVFADYETSPREYELSVAQTVLRVHTRVADLYNDPMNQLEQQLRLTVEALRERQEHEMVNSRSFGLLHNADFKQRIHTRGGPPTPDDLDELLATVWKEPGLILAHPRAIAAIGRECNRRGLAPQSANVGGHAVPAWRGVPIFPCNKIPVSPSGVSSILAMRTGEERQGVVGLRQTGIPDEYEPGLTVRFMGISDKAIISYLVSAYYSAAVLVPDALGILENVEVGN
ncbi:family 2B encapsulin nanocompartment shell protein [Streptomyces sp. SAJ15]|uniref:family 2B encapsulin nanocompartment shell protein n=1 Tax=Streptomyces sp. SAJ15 TaxID=2011095 RepID=UPI0011863A07|nr:family 2B encapsulin nanocompartment shell protein [Streptomyces sp. SAJ15]TVL89580.1 Crp/Fnr family transcriptional regulator [Streptomyces sp. SAJ15]